jgi:hypothetical protein
MAGVLKKGIGLVVVLFIVWYLFTNPAGLATTSKEIGTWVWDMLVKLFQALTQFLTTIFSKN